MNITKAQYARIEKCFPVQRGNVKIDNYTFINAILYIAENGCKWRALPEKYGKWNSIYQRFKRWCENGVIQRIFNALQQEKIIAIKVEVLALDSTSCKLHPRNGTVMVYRTVTPMLPLSAAVISGRLTV